jgi:AraC-like DNA-binding protein
MANDYDTLIGGMRTRFIRPSPILKPYIKVYAFFSNDNMHELVNLKGKPIPNGTIDLLFHFNNNRGLYIKDRQVFEIDNFLMGLSELDNSIRISPGPSVNNHYQGMCVTFTYTGMLTLLDVKLSELTNRITPVTELWGSKIRLLIERLNTLPSDEEKAKTVDDYYTAILKSKQKNYFKELIQIFDVISGKEGRLTVDDIAGCINMSYRTVHRKFQDEIGLCPKEYLKIVRFDRVCKLLAAFPNAEITDIVYDCGYFDQAHFINEFSLIMKKPPGEFLKKSHGNFYLSMSYSLEH